MNRDKHIWEGWTVGDFIDEIEPIFKNIYQMFITIFYKNQDYDKDNMEII